MSHPAKRKRVPVHGVLLLDKPEGISSTQALAKVKWLLNAEKAGHTGTLDPFATGLLPLCFGEATKFASDLLDADKTYEATIRLGITTTTGDPEGDVLETRAVDVQLAQIEAALDQFRGPIDQIPPMYSALKRDGKPLYAYARAGQTLERDARAVTIHELQLISFTSPDLQIRVRCSKGTYIRVLGEDLGQALGTGAHLVSLRRVGVGSLRIDEAMTIDLLEAAPEENRKNHLLPVDRLLSDLITLILPPAQAGRFLQGQRLALEKEGVDYPNHAVERVKVVDTAQTLLGVASLSSEGTLQPERLVSMNSRPKQR
ncbi:MAG: tRNA pseudouridine(55) synthase [Pseudomonadota bacterium]